MTAIAIEEHAAQQRPNGNGLSVARGLPRGRKPVGFSQARQIALCLLLFAAPHNLFGLDRDRTIAQYQHTGWAVADGVPGGIHGLAQTTDGYLWLASTSGLIRFDGVRFERYEPKQGGTPQFRDISALLATPDGGLWIGRAGKATYLRNGRAVTYGSSEGLLLATVFRFVLDRQGTVWAATSRGLERFENSRWNVVGPEWNFSAKSATDLFVDSGGYLWVTAPGALFCLPPNTRSFRMRKAELPWLLRETPDGTLWMCEYGGAIHAVHGPVAQVYERSKLTVRLDGGPRQVLVDREGSIWFTDRGIARIANPEVLAGLSIDSTSSLIERFTQREGLTGDTVLAALEDREGSIWVATTAGLDRFRRRNIVPGGFPFSGESALAILTDRQATVLAGNGHSLMQFRNGGLSILATIRMGIGSRFPETGIRSVYSDPEGAFWLGGHGVLTRVAGEQVENVELPTDVLPGYWDIEAITRDHAGDLWVSIQQHGVYRRHQGVWSHFGRLEGLATERTPVTLWTDVDGRVWLGYAGAQIVRLQGQEVRDYTSDGLQIGAVTFIGGRGNHIWLVGRVGLALFDGNAFRTIASEADANFNGITGVVETDNGDFWLNQASGVAHVSAAEIAARMRDARHKLRYQLFDFRDGVPGSATPNGPLPSAVLAGDGRIWMSGSNGTYWVDPTRIYKNPLPPPVAIEGIYAEDRRYDPSETSRLPVLPSNVRIEYTALSLSIPERVRFRYQLEGVDNGWQDAGTRRTAYYTRLPPGHFVFHVIASNNDGVWNQTGAVAVVVVPPAFFQTTWFMAICVGATGGIAWLAYRWRLRQIAAHMNVRLEERVTERTRLARDLHDTLLQGFQGLMLRLQALHDLLPQGEAKDELEHTLDRADQVVAESRMAVHDLRLSTVAGNDLAQAVRAMGDELSGENSATFDLLVEGRVHGLHPIVRDEIYRIAREALRNAFMHARARHIEAEIIYAENLFRLRIRDDGEGIAPAILEDGRPGHYGLPGMRERAAEIGAKLDIWSGVGTGTEIDLSIAGPIAYGKSPGRSRLRTFLEKGGMKS
jgi:signal transduction histidine kinase/ligand-binding sensor domain-containing protein